MLLFNYLAPSVQDKKHNGLEDIAPKKSQGKKRTNTSNAPVENKAYFYTLVTKESKEQTFALNRQKFLAGQGYRYLLQDFSTLSSSSSVTPTPT